MNLPFHAGPALTPLGFREVRFKTIFDEFKWDPQAGDISALARYPVILSKSAWNELKQTSETLAAETIDAEQELVRRPELSKSLGLPKRVWKLLAAGSECLPDERFRRVMRFDFHFTTDGWRISEVNSDVPGGFVEAEGFTRIMAERYAELNCTPAGYPGQALARMLIQAGTSPSSVVALVHASAYTDDRQVTLFLGREIERLGGRPVFLDPSQISWSQLGAEIRTEWFRGIADVVYRFFPAEWLPNLGRGSTWEGFFRKSKTPHVNPGASLFSQSKRFGAILNKLTTMMPAWRKYLPETRDSRPDGESDDNWVIKPAFGRVGESIAISGITPIGQRRAIRKAQFFSPSQWVAQRRFRMVPVETPDGPRYLCFGVYVINGQAAGIYCRASSTELINHSAQDVACLVASPDSES